MIRYPKIFCTIISFFYVFASYSVVYAQIELPPLISDGMVVQRHQAIPVWGWSEANAEIVISFAGQKKSVRSNAEGAWQTKFGPQEAGGPFSLQISHEKESITIQNILVGDVWLCSGQSNMEWVLRNTEHAKEEMASVNYEKIRHFKVPHAWSAMPSERVPGGSWAAATSENVGLFTAVGYYFAKTVHMEENIPIGLLNSSWGGSKIEAWMSPDALGKSKESIAQSMALLAASIESKTHTSRVNHAPAALYNKMLHPLFVFPIKGILWYQGESNATVEDEAYVYREQFEGLIKDWRAKWQKIDLPFYWVQLANYNSARNTETNSPWATIRESQAAALALPNTGQVVTIDVGNAADIHPRDKKTVGKRLAFVALNKTYGKKIFDYSGPVLTSFMVQGSTVKLIFNNCGSKLYAADSSKDVKGFEIAGKDNKFKPAKATIKNNTVILTNESVKQPTAVRYAWDDNPEAANLVGKSGLPAGPFRQKLRP